MKLKILPPTLRKNKRYLTIEIKSEVEISKDNLVVAIWDACVRFKGECETSNFDLWVMKFYSFENRNGYFYYKAIIKCQRGYESQVRASLILLTQFKNNRISINTLGLSGTIEAAQKKYIN